MQGLHHLWREQLANVGLTFEDDIWDMAFRATTAQSPCNHKLTFGDFPPSMKDEVKLFLVRGWLVANRSNGWMSSTLATLRKFMRLLTARYGMSLSLLALTQQDAIAVEDEFRQSGRAQAREDVGKIVQFASFLRERYAGQPADFHPDPRAVPRTNRPRTYTDGLERVIPDEVSAALMQAVTQHEGWLETLSRTRDSRRILVNHIYLVVIKLLVFSGRRISEILLLGRECLREPTSDEVATTGPGVWLIHDNTKVGLGEREVFISEPAAALIRSAVQQVRTLTEPLAAMSGLDKLFLTTPPKKEQQDWSIRTLSASAFRSWLNGYMTDEGTIVTVGFVHRYSIKYQGMYYQLDPHQARHTLAHKAYLGGASYVDVADHLDHHRTESGLSPMTGVYLHGQAKDVLQIQEMHERRLVTGKAAPLLENRAVNLKVFQPADLALWRDQGMVVHPTHYGHCILLDIYGPCVCGDPCYIGPRGDGCDYALYTPESKAALLVDRRLIVESIEDLESKNPQHPRLSQWKARLGRIDQVLQEIADAEARAAAGEPPKRPRLGTVPQETDPDPGEPCIPAQPSSRVRRRQNARKALRKLPAKSRQELFQPLDPRELAQADALLEKLKADQLPMALRTFAGKVGISTQRLQNCAAVFDRLIEHNTHYPLTQEQLMESQLVELREQGQETTDKDFARSCGLSAHIFYERYREWDQRISQHNAAVRQRHVNEHLLEILASGASESIKTFAKHVHIRERLLRQECQDSLQRLVEHNRAVARQQVSEKKEQYLHAEEQWRAARQGEKRARRSKHEEALASFLTEIERSQEAKNFAELAAVVGMTRDQLNKQYPEWKKRLETHNQAVITARLKAAWERMDQLGTVWSIHRFATEAGMRQEVLVKQHPDWVQRLEAKQEERPESPWARRLHKTVDEAIQSLTFVSPTQVAKQADVNYTTLSRHHPEEYARLVEHTQAMFRTRVEATWHQVCTSGECPTISEFAARCGFPHFSHLLAYFPEVAEQVRALTAKRIH